MKTINKNKMAYLNLDKMLDDYNKKKQSGKSTLDRTSFGREIWGESKSYEVIHSTLSIWANPMKETVPSYSCAKKICKILGIGIEVYDTYLIIPKTKTKKK